MAAICGALVVMAKHLRSGAIEHDRAQAGKRASIRLFWCLDRGARIGKLAIPHEQLRCGFGRTNQRNPAISTN
jgi:hypothetical protein